MQEQQRSFATYSSAHTIIHPAILQVLPDQSELIRKGNTFPREKTRPSYDVRVSMMKIARKCDDNNHHPQVVSLYNGRLLVLSA